MSIIYILQISKLKWGCNSSKITQQIREWQGQEQNSSPRPFLELLSPFHFCWSMRRYILGRNASRRFFSKESERTLMCQVLERSKSRLYFCPLLAIRQLVESTFQEQDTWMWMWHQVGKGFRSEDTILKANYSIFWLAELKADKFIDSL